MAVVCLINVLCDKQKLHIVQRYLPYKCIMFKVLYVRLISTTDETKVMSINLQN